MNTVEERLWNYIDGTCPPDERKAIDALIAQDEAWRSKYEELLELNQEFSKMELDEPSMAFTYNVMEAIRAEQAQTPLKATINKRIIKGIGGFFVLTILVLLVLVLSNLHLTPVKLSVQLPDSLKVPDIKNYLNWPVLQVFLCFDLVLGMFLFDGWLRRRNAAKQAKF